MHGERDGQFRPSLDAAALLHAQVKEARRELDALFARWLEIRDRVPPASSSRIVALYVHAAAVEDATVHAVLRGVPPLYATDWDGSGPSGYSVTNLEPVRAYARQVSTATDTYLGQLPNEETERPIDLTHLGHGQPSLAEVVTRFLVLQLAQIRGELLSVMGGL